ncbi:MAG TPA: response regulator, partial [Thermoanaerobaculia bacterium]|nr:response regulator [Thermoanaerobaculia bacterium]
MSADVFPTAGRVLLIDDDEIIARSLCRYLAKQGCDVDVAMDQASATALMQAHRYQVVLVDPYLTGGVHLQSNVLL